MHYLTISFTHKNSTLDIRERLSYNDDTQLNKCLKKLNEHSSINESLLISTCNRIEVFCSCNSIIDATNYIFELLHKRSDLSIEELEGRADIFDDKQAIEHLFSVVSSLDSMVVGETQIAGQLKKAYRFSFDRGLCSVKIARAIKYAFKCAAEVRNSTDISSKPVSIASVAVDKAKQALPNLKGKKALIIGAGEMSMITMKHLISHGASVTLINRTKDNAQKMYVEAYSNEKDESRDVLIDDYENLADAINSHELLFTSTASNEPIITDDMIESCDFSRYWFDMAVPRDIVYSHGERINLYQIDDLKTIICENISVREDEAKESLLIVKKHVNSFFDWLQTLSIEPMIKEIYLRGFEAAHDETERVLEKGFIPKEYADEVTKLSEQVIKRFLHDFSERLRQTTDESRSQDLAHSLKYILELEK